MEAMLNLSRQEIMNDSNTMQHSLTEFNSTRANTTLNSTSSGQTIQDVTSPTRADPLIRAFQDLVIVFGVTGFIMNGFVLKAVLSKKLRHNTSNTLLTNQVIMDTLSSFLLIIVYAYKIRATHIYYEGAGGFALCILLNSDVLVFAVQVGSIASLVVIAVERYFKIVYPILHKRHYKDWMTIAGITFTWTNGILLNISVFFTSKVENGNCYTFAVWPQEYSSKVYSYFLVTWQFLIPLSLFVFFYGSILFTMRQRNRVIHGTNYNNEDMPNSVQQNAQRSQMNVIVTMISISLAFALCWSPNQIYVILLLADLKFDGLTTYYYVSMLLIFFNTCLNPFIYASKHEAVRKNLKEMFLKTKATIEIITIT